MQKQPTFSRFMLVAILAVWTLSEWYPPQGKNMVDVFDQTAQGNQDSIVAELKEASKDLREGDELSLETWMAAIGDADLREMFPGQTNGINSDFNIDEDAWGDPSEEQQRQINREILARIQKDSIGKVKLGLDLRGGTQFVLQVKPKLDESGAPLPIDASQLSQAMEIMRRRVDKFGVAEPLIQTSGEDKIIIQVPGLSQADRDDARQTISQVAKLEFRLTHPQSDALMAGQEEFVPDAELMSYDLDGRRVSHFVMTDVAMAGSHIKRASSRRNDLTGTPEIHFTLDAIGANKFAKVTETHMTSGVDPRLLCIVLDGELISAPSINSRIHSRGQITGSFSDEEATMLANSLENPLENEVAIIEERDVAPSLGRDSINKGYKAALWGLIGVTIFMVIYYLLSGVLANFALALNVVMILGILCWFDATLTLPGIAGVVLTIGMAVDANVLIFERIREELRVGKSVRGAIASGYDKAFGTIFDANITTLIASIILIYMGKGPVQGFGVTLTIGILTSMFTALVATRLVFDLLANAKWIGSDDSKRFLHLRPSADLPKFDFLKYAKPAFIASWVLVVIGFGFGLSKGKDSMLGVDFAGGYSMVMEFDQTQADQIDQVIRSGSLRENLEVGTGVDGGQIQAELQAEGATGKQRLRVDFPYDADAKIVEGALKAQFSEANLERVQLDKVGPSVSGEIQKSAFIAVVLALFGILVYVAFRYEYSFAVAAVVAILHDVAMTGGLFFLTGRELNAPIVAAALTIIGFSINDTIVIFDRIRENLRMGTRGSFKDVMNTALNQTLSRTIITSGTTLLSTATLYFFGGTVINDFAFTFLVGVITGTYSSIYIACAIVLWWHKGKRPELAAPAVDTDPVGVTS
jgi:SecD/SecF fusion protein